MTIVIIVDEIYYHKAKIFFDSLMKNWSHRVCVLCVGFEVPVNNYRFEFATVELKELSSYREKFPTNRDTYFCCESGEFLNYFAFTNDEVIVKVDADMILQRRMNSKEIKLITGIKDGQVAMSAGAKPIQTLREEFSRIRPKKSYGKINKSFPGKLGSIALYNCGLIAANKTTWQTINEKYIININTMADCFDHHAASQWLFNYLVKDFEIIDLGSTFHNGFWLIDTDVEDGEFLLHNGEMVLFNHTKFIKEYSY